MRKIEGIEQNIIWKDRKRPIFGLPLSFTKYKLTDDKLVLDSGIFGITQEEVRLYRVMDVTVKCSLIQRIFNVGTIHICSADKSTPEFDIKDVKCPIQVKDLISKKVEEERDRKKISSREFMGYDDDDNDHN